MEPAARQSSEPNDHLFQSRKAALIRAIDRNRGARNKLERLSARLSTVRLWLFLGGLAGAALFTRIAGDLAGAAFLITAAAAFVIVAQRHERIDRALKRRAWLEEFLGSQLARMEMDWSKLPRAAVSANGDPPFAVDLDIVGEKSVLRLLHLGISHEGTRRLCDWLTAPIPPEIAQIERRQRIVRQLLPYSGFRRRLWLAFREKGEEPLQGARFFEWLASSAQSRPGPWLLPVLQLLAAANLALFAAARLAGIAPYWIFTAIAYVAIYMFHHERLESLLGDTLVLERELEGYRALFAVVEGQARIVEGEAAELLAPFRDEAVRPSHMLRRFRRVVNLIGMRMNPVMRLLLNAPIPWDFYCERRLRRYKTRLAEVMPKWLETFVELEATLALCNFAWIHPLYCFPEIREAAEPHFEAEALGHPLIPHERKVRNDFAIEGAGRIDLITGSNMSGKSTFLKTVGVNLSLAFAGAPVDARRLSTSRFRLFAAIRIVDSVTDGISFFYAEVKRLKRLLQQFEAENAPPMFYFIDEIFRGTNNRERLIGSRAMVETLARKNGIGLVATHDLELVQLERTVPGVENLHFQETVVDGKMIFDYRLRPGPCPTTNAIKIMRMEGLPVPPAGEDPDQPA